MTPWQRRLRAAIAVFGVGFAILVFFAIRQPQAPSDPRPSVAREDPSAAMESRGCEIFQIRGDREDFRIECDRSVAYAGGRQLLYGVRIVSRNRQEREITITCREAEKAGDDERVLLRGDVELTTTDGMVIQAPEASYSTGEGVVRATGPVSFRSTTLSGTSVGLTYEEARGLVWLPEKATLRMTPSGPEGTPIDITSGAARLVRPDRYVQFERGFVLVDGARRLESDEAMGFFSEDESRLVLLEMRGNARVSGLGDVAGALRGMAARDIDLEFAEDGRTLSTATLLRGASVDVASSGSASRRIQATRIDARLGSDGLTLSSLTAGGGVRLDLPADGDQPARAISATSLAALGEAGQGLTSAVFTDAVEFREAVTKAGRASVERVARSTRLDLAVQPGFGAVDDARFEGAVRFEEDTVSAAAATARYRVAEGVLELEGRDASTGQLPRVSDELIAIEGQRVRLGLEGRKIDASGDVRSTMLALARTAGESPTVRRPSMLKADQPVYATAATLVYDGSAKLAEYETSARLWQGDTAIQGDRLALDDATGNLDVTGHVRSTLMLDRRGADGQVERVPTIASAEALTYDEAARRATYTTGAHVAGPQGDLRATKVELYLKPSGTEMERVEGYEAVALKLDDREATGARLTYFAADERYVMAGQPVRMLADCRETVGRALTFFRAADRIVVDGRNEIRTFTRGGAKCGEPRAQ